MLESLILNYLFVTWLLRNLTRSLDRHQQIYSNLITALQLASSANPVGYESGHGSSDPLYKVAFGVERIITGGCIFCNWASII